MNSPFITVITITLDNSSGLKKTMESVFSQEYPALEFIVIDGGSIDNSFYLLRHNESRITKWISEPDDGPYDAMNKGLQRAAGEWVIFMNAGDLFHDPDTLNGLTSHLKGDTGVIHGDSIADYGDIRVYRKSGQAAELWKGMVMCHQSVFVRTRLAKELMFNTKFFIGADFDMLYRLYLKGITFKHVPQPVSIIDAGGLSNRKMIRSAREHYRIVACHGKLTFTRKIYHLVFFLKVIMASTVNHILPDPVLNFFRKSRKEFNHKEHKVLHKETQSYL